MGPQDVVFPGDVSVAGGQLVEERSEEAAPLISSIVACWAAGGSGKRRDLIEWEKEEQ